MTDITELKRLAAAVVATRKARKASTYGASDWNRLCMAEYKARDVFELFSSDYAEPILSLIAENERLREQIRQMEEVWPC